MSFEDPYKPWLCEADHKVAITQVTDSGECRLCGSPVRYNSSGIEVQDALIQERLGPSVSIIDTRGRKIPLVTIECRNCHGVFETPYPNQAYCRSSCRKAFGLAREETRNKCLVCGNPVPGDRRWKYCKRPACRVAAKRRRKDAEQAVAGGPDVRSDQVSERDP